MADNIVSTKEVDYLDEDKPIRNQNYCLLSFISPEDTLINKESYYINYFLKDFSKDIDTLFNGIISKYPDSEDLINDIKYNHKYLFNIKELDEQYKFSKLKNANEVEKVYHADNNFKTSIRGIKVRGVFDTLEEAKFRSEFLKKTDKNFNIYTAQVGCWCPWSPNPNDLEHQEYSESQLNTLMKQYKNNMDEKDAIFDKRIVDSIPENIDDKLEDLDPWSKTHI